MMDRFTKAQRRREARLQADDAATWKCETCDTIIESGRHCWPCGAYWRDVDNGLFADDFEMFPQTDSERRTAMFRDLMGYTGEPKNDDWL